MSLYAHFGIDALPGVHIRLAGGEAEYDSLLALHPEAELCYMDEDGDVICVPTGQELYDRVAELAPTDSIFSLLNPGQGGAAAWEAWLETLYPAARPRSEEAPRPRQRQPSWEQAREWQEPHAPVPAQFVYEEKKANEEAEQRLLAKETEQHAEDTKAEEGEEEEKEAPVPEAFIYTEKPAPLAAEAAEVDAEAPPSFEEAQADAPPSFLTAFESELARLFSSQLPAEPTDSDSPSAHDPPEDAPDAPSPAALLSTALRSLRTLADTLSALPAHTQPAVTHLTSAFITLRAQLAAASAAAEPERARVQALAEHIARVTAEARTVAAGVAGGIGDGARETAEELRRAGDELRRAGDELRRAMSEAAGEAGRAAGDARREVARAVGEAAQEAGRAGVEVRRAGDEIRRGVLAGLGAVLGAYRAGL